MTAVDVVGSAGIPAAAPLPPASSQRSRVGRFHGRERAFFGLLVRGALFLLLTLGIYRFWLATDIRRFLWGNTEIADDSLEYSGTALELFVGFLMAVALLVPVYVLFFIAALDLGLLGQTSGVLALVLLALLGQFAVYRARRYRLSRTIFRGVRLYQTGSAWRYAVNSVLWWAVVALSAGIAYPWRVASLERYKLRHTHYGNLAGRFVGSGTRLFVRGFLMWLLVVGPVLGGVIAGLAVVDWAGFLAALSSEGDDVVKRAEAIGPYFGAAVVFASLGFGCALVAGALLYPAFRAMVLRWWVSGLRLGEIAAVSHLRTGQIYRVYLRFLGYSVLFAFAAGILSAAAFAVFGSLTPSFGKSVASELAASAVLIGSYVVIALGYSAIYQGTVTIRFWRLSFETAELSGLAALDGVEAQGGPSSPLGEGLADALDVGGL